MSGFFVESGNAYSLTNDLAMKVHPTLPVGVYEVNFHQMRGYWLTRKTDIKALPPKIYGSVQKRTHRILQTYKTRAAAGLQTGVLLSGNKGSGKTLLANNLIHESKLPTILVSAPYTDPEFMNILAAGGAKVVLFDEFEKVYRDTDAQAQLLSLLDGHYKTCNLTIATVNDRYKVHEAMKNRPSRFYYHYQYGSLDREFIKEYCKDKLHAWTPERMREILQVVGKVFEFNFDMLQSLVEEMNRYGDTAEECMDHLNIIPDSLLFEFTVQLLDVHTNKPMKIKNNIITVHHPHPTHMEFYVELVEPPTVQKVKGDDKEDNDDIALDENEDRHIWFNGRHFEHVTEKGDAVFKNSKYRAIMSPIKKAAAGF